MPRKVIILERVDMPSDLNFRVAFWLDVPAARRPFYADATKASAVIGATAGEVSALQSGAVVEVVETVQRPNGTTVPQVLGALQARHGRLQAELDDRNPWQRYGSSWDGNAWTAVTVA